MRMSFVSVLLLSTLCCMTTNGQAQPKVKLKTMVPAAPIETNHRPQSKLKGSVKVYSLPTVMAEGDKIWEDFAKFTVGSEETPSIREVNDEKGNIAEKYTQMPGWSGGGVFQAGGVAYIGLMDTPFGEETGFINTPVADLSANSGTYTIRFRAKSTMADGDHVLISCIAPDAEEPLQASGAIDITNEWQEYSIEMNQGCEKTMFQFSTVYTGWYFDDLSITSEGIPSPSDIRVVSYKGNEATIQWNEVEGAEAYQYNLYYFDSDLYSNKYVKKNERVEGTTLHLADLDPEKLYYFEIGTLKDGKQSAYSKTYEIKPIIGTPKAIDPEDYDGTSFTARWDAVGNADKYVLRVYSYINGGVRDAEVVPFLTESNLTETSYKVTGLSDSVIYYFTVQAMNNEGDISSESNEVQILPVVKAPKALAATHIQTNSFVAHWEKVPLANYYEATMYREYTALNDEKHIVQETDMEYIVSDGTMDSPEYSSSSYVFPRNSGAFNWVVSSPVFIAGAVGLDNSLAILSMPAYMYSPAFNLSPFGGKASFDIKLASKNTTTAVVALAVINKNKEFEEVESFEVPVTAQMTSHHIEFTKGTDEVYILIYPKDGVYLFFDEFSLAVDMPKGTSVEAPIDAMMVEDGTACRFEEVVRQSNERVSYDVVAASISAEAQILSEPSNRVYVDIQSSVESNVVAEAKAWVSGNELVIDNPNAETVEVYDLCGVLHFMSDKGDSHLEVALDSPGVYVVKVGRQVIKVMR